MLDLVLRLEEMKFLAGETQIANKVKTKRGTTRRLERLKARLNKLNKFLIIILNIITMARSQSPYQMDPLDPNPGIYFERVDVMRTKRADWKIQIYIDVDEFMQTHAPLESYRAVYNSCLTRIEEIKSGHALGLDLIKLKDQTLNEVQRQINVIIKTMTHQSYPAERNPRSIRVKRIAPLGIIGSISKSLFGLVTTDDVDNINNTLFQDQTKIVQIMD
ncbi:hypothetical protein TSAR_007932 [Trichomalopsis sarcophagae]|uniref:Uncharacterized protein n=1 Tax=Trichomalopsis sarcophagae TaxID=543379 RepID=A0A232ETA8_9HYME|nr:hypothetical protein TSAR_007932 [Trichomalopsis sarcophagae]